MRKITTSKAFARLVTDTIAGRIRWPAPPPTDEQRAKLAAEIAEAAAEPDYANAYSRHLASGADWLSRFKREHENGES